MIGKQEEATKGIAGNFWDSYVNGWPQVNKSLGHTHRWPGDEWGSPEVWERLYQQLFAAAGVQDWQRAVEIGPGSGKYTLKVLTGSQTAVRAYDVSPQFLKVCEERCREWVRAGRLGLHLLGTASPRQILDELGAAGWKRTVDGFYSIGTMVHVDLQYLIVYLLTAGLVLKPGGKLILTLADATSELGFTQLLKDICWAYPGQNSPIGTAKFEWLSPDLVRSVLGRLGFQVQWLNNRDRDILLIATLANPEMSDGFAQYLSPPPK